MSHPDVRDHPDYPFRESAERDSGQKSRLFLDAPSPGTEHDALLQEFVHLVRCFSFLERIIQGDVLFELPVHPAVTAPEAESLAEAEGERLAEAERRLLATEAGEALDLFGALDEIGIKVFRLEPVAAEASDPESHSALEGKGAGIWGAGGLYWPDLAASEPAGVLSPATGVERVLSGAFFFEGASGPALLVGGDRDSPEAAYIMAHEFAHLVADVDPYRPRFCRWRGLDLQNLSDSLEEKRADRFARGLLLPPDHVARIWQQLSQADRGDGFEHRLETLAQVFEVPPPVARMRLIELGLASQDPESAPRERRQAVAGPARSAGAGRERPGSRSDRLSLPERYVHLALAAYAERILEIRELARFLRTSPMEAMRMARWARIPRRREEAI